MIRIFNNKLGVFRVSVVFEVKRISFQFPSPADNNGAFSAELFQHVDRIQVKDGCEEKTYIIDHDDASIQASDRVGNQVDCLFRAVRTGNFQEFIIKKLSGFTNLPPFPL